MIEPALRRFFDELAPMLLGRRTARHVEEMLGPSASGSDALAFYAELAARNVRKIIRDIFPCTRILATRTGVHWDALVDRYRAAHTPSGNDPNEVAAAFAPWLATLGVEQARWAELADLEWLRVRAHHAADVGPDDDGFERRLFVREYTFDVPTLFAALARDPSAPIPEPSPTIVIVHRHATTLRVHFHRPGALALAALALRQGLALPAGLAALDPARVRNAERALVEAGVLMPRTSRTGAPS